MSNRSRILLFKVVHVEAFCPNCGYAFGCKHVTAFPSDPWPCPMCNGSVATPSSLKKNGILVTDPAYKPAKEK